MVRNAILEVCLTRGLELCEFVKRLALDRCFPFITIDKIEYYRHAEMCRRIYHVLHEAHFAARMLRAFLNKHNAFKNLAMKDKIKTGWRAKFG